MTEDAPDNALEERFARGPGLPQEVVNGVAVDAGDALRGADRGALDQKGQAEGGPVQVELHGAQGTAGKMPQGKQGPIPCGLKGQPPARNTLSASSNCSGSPASTAGL